MLGLATELADRRSVFYCSVGGAWKVPLQARLLLLFLALTLLMWLLVAAVDHSLRNVCVQRSSWDAFAAKVVTAATTIGVATSSVRV